MKSKPYDWVGKTVVPTVVYVDGSFLHHKGQVGGWAAIIVQGDTITEMCGADQPTTNNRMEMMGALKALQSIAVGANVFIHTDSQYLQQSMSLWIHLWKKRGWKTKDGKPVKNKDLLQLLDIECNRLSMVSWHWVKGHDGHVYNERADDLARKVAEARWSFSGQYDYVKEPV